MARSGSEPPGAAVPTDLPRLRRSHGRCARLVFLGWLLAGLGGAAALPSLLSPGQGSTPTAASADESGRAEALLQPRTARGERAVAVVLTAPRASEPSVVTAPVQDAGQRVRDLSGVAHVADPAAQPLLRTGDGSARLLVVDLDAGLDAAARNRVLGGVTSAARDLQARLRADGDAAATVRVASATLLRQQADAGAARDLLRAQLVALPLLLAVTAVVSGGLAAGLLPVLAAVATLGGGLLLLRVVRLVVAVPSYAVDVVALVGVAVAADYALLVLLRFREELGAGRGRASALAVADATAGRTATVSGLTVAACLCGLLLTADPALVALGAGGAAAALVAVLVARTLLPALLAVLSPRVRPVGAAARPPGRGWERLGRSIGRRPSLVGLGAAALLVACAAPVLALRVGSADARALPSGAPAREAVLALQDRFPLLPVSPVTVVTGPTQPAQAPAASSYLDSLQRLPGVLLALPHEGLAPGVRAVDLVVGGGGGVGADGQGSQARDLVMRLRAERPDDLAVSVTGDAAGLLDHSARLRARLPAAAAVVLLVVLGVLLATTRSLLLACSAVLAAGLSLAAGLGLLVLTAQEGHLLPSALGGGAPAPLQLEVPLVVAAVALGLGLDYEVFLLLRVQEARAAGADAVTAVSLALARTGRVVTGAALLVVVVAGGAASGEVLPLRQLGLGLALAVAVDASVVRCLLVPAVTVVLLRGRAPRRAAAHPAP